MSNAILVFDELGRASIANREHARVVHAKNSVLKLRILFKFSNIQPTL